MIPIKNQQQIEKMREGGKILAQILAEVKKAARVGVKTGDLDKLAESLINKSGGKPSFQMVPGYHWATCMCVNEVVVHGIPDGYKLQIGDILGIDIGIFYQRFHTDMAETVSIVNEGSQDKSEETDQFLAVGKKAFSQAFSQAKVGNRVGHISEAIGQIIKEAGFSPVEALVGHGVGRELHEPPPIPCLLKGDIKDTPELVSGMTLAVEVIYNQESPEVVYRNDDGWTIQTKDGKLSGLYENTIAILEDGPEILTQV
jgi:methionyl aminopeptidase